MSNFKNKLIEWIIQKPYKVLLGNIFFLTLFLPGFTLITSDFSYRAWYSDGDRLLQQYDLFESKFGNDDSLIIGIEHQSSVLNPKTLKKIDQIVNDLWKIKKIIRVDAITNFDHLSSDEEEIVILPLVDTDNLENFNKRDFLSKISGDKLVESYLVSKDEKLTVIRINLRPIFKQSISNKETISEVKEVISRHQDSEHNIFLTGNGTFIELLREITFSDMSLLIPLVGILFTLLLFLIFKDFKAVLLTIVTIFTSNIIMGGSAGFLGQALNTISSASPVILLTVAVADTVHILTVYFYGLKQKMSHVDALKYSLDKNFIPTLLTSITTAIGFFSFSGSLIKSLSHMGIQIGIGVIAAWICTYGILGPLMRLFGDKGHLHQKKKHSSHSFAKIYINFLYRYKRSISLFSLFLFCACFYGIRYLEINLDPHVQFPHEHVFSKSMRIFKRHFPSTTQAEIMIPTENAKDPLFLAKVDKLQNWLEAKDYIHSTISINDIIKKVNHVVFLDPPNTLPDNEDRIGQGLLFYTLGLPPGRDLNNRLSLSNDAVRITINWELIKTKDVMDHMTLIKDKAVELGLTTAFVTGKTPLFHSITPYVVESFIESFAIALFMITIILILVLKSVTLGLLALIPNLYPLAISAGLFAFSGEYIDVATVLVASICLSIAVDDSIHFLVEFRKSKDLGLSTHNALEKVFANTAPSLINTTTLIAIGFGALCLADYLPNVKFGFLTSLTLIIALIADLFILPAILIWLDQAKKTL
ncbi:MAG: hypothetical protein CME65_10800 [Halobacteriovoraceae bacterium]|nr:hypothetical protein [Halobacteriovoraceae bacterium]